VVSKIKLYVIAVIISMVFVGGSWSATGTPDVTLLRYLSIAVLVCSALLLIWDQWLWKIRPFQLLPQVARDLNGTWEATLESLWVDPETQLAPAPKTVYVVIRQTSSEMSVSLISNESKSKSSLARIVKEEGSWLVHYLYTNEPLVDLRERSPIHHGSGVLNVVGNPPSRIAGVYWTDRNSKGKLALGRKSKRHADDFEGAAQLF
jgi:hypothetical protein